MFYVLVFLWFQSLFLKTSGITKILFRERSTNDAERSNAI